MNRTSLFPALAFGGGALAYILRLMQNRTGFEFPSGLPVAGNLWAILLPVVLAVILAASLVLGSVTAPVLAWTVADAAIATMTILNLGVLVLLRNEVKEETKKLPLIVRRQGGCISCKEKDSERSRL